jgi:O-antigen ligase
MFVSVGRIQELIPGFESLYLGKVFGALMFAAYFIYSGPKNRFSLKDSPELVCILGIVFFAFLSVPFSVWPGNSLGFLLNFLIKNVAFSFIIARTLTTANQLNKLILALLAASLILSIMALTGRADISRVSAGVTYDANDLAFVLLCALPFAAFGFFEERGIRKLLLLVIAGLIMATVIFTQSRGGFLCMLVVGGIILLKIFKKRKTTGILFVGMFIALFAFLASSSYWARLSTILEPGDDYNISSPAGRIEVWKRGFTIMIENPLTGGGIGNFTTAEGLSHKKVGGMWMTAHNSFIQIGGELGIGGLILFILLFYYLFKTLRKITPKDSKSKTLKDSLEVSLIGYITGGFFLSQAYSMILYVLIGISVALACIVKKESEDVQNSEKRDGNPLL